MNKNNETGNDSSSRVERHFHRKHRQFDSFYEDRKGPVSRLIDAVFRRSMRLRFEKVIEGAAPYENKTVLDVGCGAGRYSIALALNGIKHAFGIDFALNMIEEAAQRARQLKVDHICRFEKADFMQIDVETKYHHTFAMGVLDYIENPGAFVQKMVQVTSETVMVSFPSSGGIVQWFRRHYFYKIKKCPVYFYSQEDVRRIAQQAGGQSFTIDKLAKDYFLTITVKD